MPYLYIPVNEFTQVGVWFDSWTLNKPIIDSTNYLIYWDNSCNNMGTFDHYLSFEMTVTDDTNSYTITVDSIKMLVKGESFGMPNKCFFPVFRHYEDESSPT